MISIKSFLFLFITFIISFQSFSFGNDKITKYEDLVKRQNLFYKKFTNIPFSGKIEGFFISDRYGKSNTYSRGYIENGKKNGDWENYFYDGKLKSKGKILNNVRIGKWIFYKNDGTIIGESTYDPKLGFITNGPEVLYSNTKKGNVIRIERYSNGKLEGRQEYFYEDNKGKTKQYFDIKNGKKDGFYFDTYRDTQFRRETGMYKNGKLDGLNTVWWNELYSRVQLLYRFKNDDLLWKKEFNKEGYLIKFTKYETPEKWDSDKTVCEYRGVYSFNTQTPLKCYFVEKNNFNKLIPKPKNVLNNVK